MPLDPQAEAALDEYVNQRRRAEQKTLVGFAIANIALIVAAYFWLLGQVVTQAKGKAEEIAKGFDKAVWVLGSCLVIQQFLSR